MKHLPQVILGSAVFCLFFFTYQYDVHWPPWAFTTILAATVLSWRLWCSRKIPWTAAGLFWWVLVSGLVIAEWRPATASPGSGEDGSRRMLAAQALVEFLLLSGLFFTQWKRIRVPLGWGLFIGGFFHSIFLITDQWLPKTIHLGTVTFFSPTTFFYPMDAIGLLGNRSIGASFTAVWTFFACHFVLSNPPSLRIAIWLFYLAATLGLLAVATAVSSISYGAIVFGGMAVALSVFHPIARPLRLLKIVTPFIVAGIAGAWIIGPKYYDTNMLRIKAWPMFASCWYSGCSSEISNGKTVIKSYMEPANIVFGWGAGNFKYFGPTIQDMYDFMVDRNQDLTIISGKYWLWAHNDWLQVLFEFGIIGLLLALATTWSFAKLSFDRPLLFGALAAFCGVSLGNYGLHIALTSLLFWWIASETLWGSKGAAIDGP